MTSSDAITVTAYSPQGVGEWQGSECSECVSSI